MYSIIEALTIDGGQKDVFHQEGQHLKKWKITKNDKNLPKTSKIG